jgi:transcriptional regulator with XRE-family HTH domain
MLSCVVESGSTSMSTKPLNQAIREAFTGLGLNQVQLAQRMGVDQTTISRLANGKWGEQGGPTPDILARIEEAAGRPRGWILIQAGYVDDVRSTAEAIAVDPDLSDSARQIVSSYYQGVVQSLKDSGVRGD